MNNLYKTAFFLAARSSHRQLLRGPATFRFIQAPLRMVHARGYNDFYDNWSFIFHEINFALSGSKTTDAFAFVFKKYGKHMTDF